ncbi:nuclear transport factor 2 family protein [Inhella gelatinilytica]|uniref:Nuclear transport factor 2 family protein n=1 Tax=Inhella gelatinilytica TaxID=2795030 RepID=A0A931NC24_9BURK|nr:nuclear transport factor 2 family protein [Inhella gelatinilytica]MBH9551537.1 nuclear transport factor 2 family protein [Inhella gelatinilytica]
MGTATAANPPAAAPAQPPRPTLAERSAQTEAVARPYFEAYIARDWDRLEPLLDEHIRFDDATAHVVFGGAVGKQGKTELMKAFRETYAAIRAMRFHPQSQFASGEHMVFVGELEWSLGLADGAVVDTRMPFVVRLQVRQGKVLEHLDTADYKPFATALRQVRQAAAAR